MAGNGSEGLDPQAVRAELERVRTEVESGNTDLKGLGFWTLVGRLKRRPELANEFADEVGAIDRAAFERRFRIRPPVWLGNLVLLLGTAGMIVALVIAIELADDIEHAWVAIDGNAESAPGGPSVQVIRFDKSNWSGVWLLLAGTGLPVVLHDLGHWVVGRMGGIRFSSYFLDGPFKIQPGLKSDYATYLRARPEDRARMHAAGAVVSKVAPFAVFGVAYWKHASYAYELFPEWSLWGLLAFGVIQIITDLVWSTRKSDWKKWRRERRVAADLYSRGTTGELGEPG